MKDESAQRVDPDTVGGEDRAAIARFDETLRLKPSEDRALYGRGLIYLNRRDFEKAILDLKEAARLQYFNPYAGYYLAIAYQLSGQFEKAVKEYQRIKSFDPNIAAQTAREIGYVDPSPA